MKDATTMAKDLQVDIRNFQKVSRIDSKNKKVFVQDNEIEYSDLVLALGAEPIRLPITGHEHLMQVNDLMDYRVFQQSVQNKQNILVLGAGLVGCEFAHDLASAGFNVHLVAPETHPLSRLLPKDCGEALISALQDLGVTLSLGRSAVAVSKQTHGFEVTLDDDQKITSDVVLSAVGLKARTDLAKQAGLSVGRGIRVNRQLQTSEEHIYALGDCAEVAGLHLLYVLPLMNCARSLAKTLTGQESTIQYPVMPIIIKTPSLPIVTCPPEDPAKGQWHIDGQSPHLKALFKDANEALLGYALTGNYVAEKFKLNMQLSEHGFQDKEVKVAPKCEIS